MDMATIEITEEQLDSVFGALADRTRRAILARLAAGEASVNELCAPFAVSQPAISQHLKVLERAGLISRSRKGAARLSHLRAEPVTDAVAWLGGSRGDGEGGYGGPVMLPGAIVK